MLQGARLVTASETEQNRKWAASRIKQLTGGDPISARLMRQDFFTYVPQFKLILVGNHAPQLGRVDDAIRRRLLVILFDRRPAVPDKKLEEKLKAEWPGILRWMIKGCLLWQQQELNPPSAVTTATQEYFEQEDVFGQWLDECCEVNPDEIVWVVEAFVAWKKFAEDRGHDAGNETSFSTAMRKQDFEKKTRNVPGKGRPKVWIGIRLRGAE